MSIRTAIVGAALAFAATGTVHAVPIVYEGTISPAAPVTGSVSGTGWATETAAGVDFWRFNGIAGEFFSVQANRLNSGLDPALTLYFGTTTADESQFLRDADWGGLVYLRLADDEIAVPGGPGGDPLLTDYLLPFSGFYTIAIGGFSSTGSGPFGYSMQVTAIPEPETVLLMSLGLAAVGLTRRRRRASSV
jgi:hypothetical protein